MDPIKVEKDRSCALQVLEGHRPEDYRLSHFDRPAPLITSHLHHEPSLHDSASTQASTSSLWSGVLSQCGSAFSRTTSIASSLKSDKRQQSSSSLSYLQIKPLPPLPPEEPSPLSFSSPETPSLQLPESKLCLSPSKAQQQNDLVLTDHYTPPLISPALSNSTTSSTGSYASHLIENPTDSFCEHVRIFHPHSQSSHITAALLDTGSDCCCIRLGVLHSLGISPTSSLIRPTTLSTRGITGSTWRPLGRIELTWLPLRGDGGESEAHHTWFFVGDKELPYPIVLGKDFLLPKEGPPRVFVVLVNVLNRPSKAERNVQKEAEKRHKKLVRDNEKAKEARMALLQAYDSRSCLSSDTCSSKSTAAEKP
ncbi:hypothetical protein OIDMADRAFT_148674 [Oidiodendron maius Zn]|uniref:Uncharacterized protein n=1 Tax=Oidiodendron maius (strain Zn) TaxID=913774 RepID=A0A0C3GJC7_OIDMZ|nr:hypothetical protein OIDMADRAFT_148674 [Oidiodendron maius Zn]